MSMDGQRELQGLRCHAAAYLERVDCGEIGKVTEFSTHQDCSIEWSIRNSFSGSVGNVNSRRGLWPVKTFGRLGSHHSTSNLGVNLCLTFPTTRMFFFCGRADARTHNSGSLINSPPIHRSVGIPVLGALSMRSRCAILYMTVT